MIAKRKNVWYIYIKTGGEAPLFLDISHKEGWL